MKNLLENIPGDLPEELFETLADTQTTQIRRIVSKGHCSPQQGWYDQDENEFVLVLKGAARLEFEDGATVEMGPGDWLQIPANCRHRVAWTDPGEQTIWLAVHYF